MLQEQNMHPDFSRLERVLRRQHVEGPVCLYDLFSNIEVPVLKTLGQSIVETETLVDDVAIEAWMFNHIRYMEVLGYDYANVWDSQLKFTFPGPEQKSVETNEGKRTYVTSDWNAFEDESGLNRYAWPDPDKIPFERLDKYQKMVPDGMKFVLISRGILETTMDLLGHEQICYLVYDSPELVRNVFQSVGERFLRFYELAVNHPSIGAVTYCDDMGFKTQTLLAPDTYREFLFPFHKKLNEIVHKVGKPTILHSCGCLDMVMKDIIACGWDAKQSFEDCIEPIWVAKEKYGDRIALLGGFDVDKLCRMTEQEVREHTRMLIKTCAPGGGWALGTGNSVPNYIPIQNYLAMMDEGRRTFH